MKGTDVITTLPGIGPAVAQKYAVLGIKTIDDLIHHYPRRYEDYSNLLPISSLKPGPVSISATYIGATGRYIRRGMHITEAVAKDDTGSVRLVWFNQPVSRRIIEARTKIFPFGIF